MAMTWKNIYKSNYLTRSDVYALNNNFLYLQEKLNSFEILCSGVEKIDYIDPLFNVPDIFNHIETDMEAINAALNSDGIYLPSFGAKYSWSYAQRDIINKVWRWYDFMWDAYNSLTDLTRTKALLYCDDGNGETVQVYDINGQEIFTEV